jgi:ATP-dependent Clp protease ATP-binding subunit ClpB
MVLNQLSKDIIAARVNRDRPIIIDANGNELIFRN